MGCPIRVDTGPLRRFNLLKEFIMSDLRLDPNTVKTQLDRKLVFIGPKLVCQQVAEIMGIDKHDMDHIPHTRPTKVYGMKFEETPVLCGETSAWPIAIYNGLIDYFMMHGIPYLEIRV